MNETHWRQPAIGLKQGTVLMNILWQERALERFDDWGGGPGKAVRVCEPPPYVGRCVCSPPHSSAFVSSLCAAHAVVGPSVYSLCRPLLLYAAFQPPPPPPFRSEGEAWVRLAHNPPSVYML